MADSTGTAVPLTTLPPFETEASQLTLQLASLSTEEVEQLLRVNRQIASEKDRKSVV